MGLPPTWSGWTPTEGIAWEGKAAREAAAGGEGAAGLALLLLAAHGGLEDGEEIAVAGVEDRVTVLSVQKHVITPDTQQAGRICLG